MKEQWDALVRDKRNVGYIYGSGIAFIFALFTFIFKDTFSLDVSLTTYGVLVASIMLTIYVSRDRPLEWQLIGAFISALIIYLLHDESFSLQILVLVTILATLHLTREQVPLIQLASVVINAAFIYLAKSQLDKSGIIIQIDEGQVPIRFSTHYFVTAAMLVVLYLTRAQPIMVKESSAVSVGFLSWFAAKEFNGLIVLGDTIVNALGSAGDFFDNARIYFVDVAGKQTYVTPFFTWFDADWLSPLALSMLFGAAFGGVTTAIVFLNKRGLLKFPRFSDRSIFIGIFTAIAIEFHLDWLAFVGIDLDDLFRYLGINTFLIPATSIVIVATFITLIIIYYYEDQFLQILSEEQDEIARRLVRLNTIWLATMGLVAVVIDQHFWAMLMAGGVVSILIAFLYEGQAESYLRLETVTSLLKIHAIPAILLGLLIGGLVGAVGSQILNYPLKHCTFGPDLSGGRIPISRLEFRIGLVITAFSALLLLLPAWTLIRRGGLRVRRGFTSGYFNNNVIPYLFLFPTLFILVVFLYYPGVRVVTLSLKLAILGRPNQLDYCLTNFEDNMISQSLYRGSFMTSLVLSAGIVAFSMMISLGIAALASQKIRGIGVYRTLLIWPYAISPVVAGVMLKVAFDPIVGIVNWLLTENAHSAINFDDFRTIVAWVIALVITRMIYISVGDIVRNETESIFITLVNVVLYAFITLVSVLILAGVLVRGEDFEDLFDTVFGESITIVIIGLGVAASVLGLAIKGLKRDYFFPSIFRPVIDLVVRLSKQIGSTISVPDSYTTYTRAQLVVTAVFFVLVGYILVAVPEAKIWAWLMLGFFVYVFMAFRDDRTFIDPVRYTALIFLGTIIFFWAFYYTTDFAAWRLESTLGGERPQWFSDTNLAPMVVIGAAVWNSIGFNVLFYMAGLQSIPTDLLEAAAIDGANRFQRFMRITIPLLSPYSFFLLITNITYSFFGLFGVVDILTKGGPFTGVGDDKTGATNILIYNIYDEFFNSRRLGAASAQSLVLFLLVAAITILQFRYVERRVTYGGE